MNQERIKTDGMKRTINELEGKNEKLDESSKTLYEEVLSKNMKIGQMEDKLK